MTYIPIRGIKKYNHHLWIYSYGKGSELVLNHICALNIVFRLAHFWTVMVCKWLLWPYTIITILCRAQPICWYPVYAGIILCMRPANKRRHCNETSSLIGWVHSQNNPCLWHCPQWGIEMLLYVVLLTWAPSQYKDRLIYVWRFPC